MSKHKYIAVAGNIGSGKSTLVQFLATQYQVTPFYEPNDENPYLADFYADMNRWAFHSQVFFLTHKLRIHKKLEEHQGVVVLDRTIYEDAEIFATALYRSKKMQKRDFDTYWDLYQSVSKTLRPPDLMIYLKCSVATLKKRIALRGREMERSIPTAYLHQLEKLYDEWIAGYNSSELIVVDTGKLDYISDLVHRIDIIATIEKALA